MSGSQYGETAKILAKMYKIICDIIFIVTND